MTFLPPIFLCIHAVINSRSSKRSVAYIARMRWMLWLCIMAVVCLANTGMSMAEEDEANLQTSPLHNVDTVCNVHHLNDYYITLRYIP